ncbi:MAG: cob(I)yrinic acid a,c-diamide adenosyltransferase [Candidatus Omnitrophica bacterium]|nr:cob(I)yrinic acid a,c-diamide adenosyltransferase [Candidatus Omnitrophota bacterium]
MRITTRQGDGGRTRLCGGRAVSKCDPSIKAQGAIDELISFLGLAKVKIKDRSAKKKIGLIQRDLFSIIGCISSGGRKGAAPAVKDCDVRMLEEFGDLMEGRGLMPSGFVIPGVNEGSAVLHVARTVARRAECCVVELGRKSKIDPCILAYLNRLSDLLFVLAVREEGRPDLLKR